MSTHELYYHGRSDLIANICHNAQEFFMKVDQDQAYLAERFHNLLHHEVILPHGVSSKFQNFKALWGEVINYPEDENHLYKAFHLILPLKKNVHLTHNISLCRQVAQGHFISQGVPVQVDIHSEDEMDSYLHAHLLVPPFTFSDDGQALDEWIDVGMMNTSA